ncbi:hypothetical protein [Sphingomonas sp. Root241]|jgi:hypothetical protein|uniref:hypothetical protein n=1 Tax=Sphingomonas sp. Root241 TaxID=1736501 RepID=UPI0006F6B1A3|nr:hypothetical protein [Sphingomonas sp. Root241]KRC82090.1 hypothetical protein ASE13_07085 [Sphingomonas sp. Root241]
MTESPALNPFAARKLAPHPEWPAERQRAFLYMLLRTGDVPAAAASVGASAHAVTCFRRSLGRHSAFSRAWRRAVEEAEADALATRVLRRGGLDAAQLARVDAACHGMAKARLALALAYRANRAAKGPACD